MGGVYPKLGTHKPYRVLRTTSRSHTEDARPVGVFSTAIQAASRAIGLVLLVLMFLSGSLLAQTGRTTISGRVVDPSGAVVAGATVVVTNVETNFTVSLVSNEKGHYEASQLLPGQYKITVDAAGFSKLVRQGITLVAGTPISIELSLAVGKNQETLVVTADAPLINTEPASSGQVVTSDTIANAPVSSANATLLTKFASGVTANYASNWYMAGNLNATGNVSNIGTAGQNNKNQFYLDGAPNASNSGNVAYVPSTDEIAEMKTETSGFDASLGKTLGVSVVATSKAGTNEFHGGLRELYYARRWQSMSHFASTTYAIQYAKNCSADPSSAACSATKTKYGNPGLIEHNSGFNLGGPVIIPKVFNGKDKLFFFININRDDYTDAAQQTATVPTAQQRLGNFSDLCSSSGCGTYQIYNPLSVTYNGTNYVRTAVPGNDLRNVPALAALMNGNKLAAFVNQYYPLPNMASGGSYAVPSNYSYTQIKPTLYKSYLWRTDFTPNQKDRFNVRLTKSDWTQNVMGLLKDDLDHREITFRSNVVTTGWTHMFSSAAILDTSVGYTQWSSVQHYPNLAKFTSSDLGLPSYVDSMAASSWAGYTQLPVIDYSSTYSAFGTNAVPTDLSRHLSLRSGLSYITGNHTFTLGGEVRQQLRAKQDAAYTSGRVTFGNTYTRASSSSSDSAQMLGLGYASLLLGIPERTQYDIPASQKNTNPYFAWYAQDSWRVSPKLTLSLGLRYEYEYGPREAWGREVTYWDPTATQPIASVAQANYATLFTNEFKKAFADAGITAPASAISILGGNSYAGLNGATSRRWDNNWRLMPRIGVAYQLTPTTVLRGGYGLFFDTTNVTTSESVNQNGFSRSTVDTVSDDYGMTWKMGNPAAGISPLTDPFYVQASGSRYLSPVGNALGSSAYLGGSYSYYPHDYKPARQQRWQAEIQKRLGNRDAITVGYTGSWTDHLVWQQNLNSIPGTYYTGGTTQNPLSSVVSKTVTNPFYIGNFADLKASNPTLYNLLASSGTFTSRTTSLGSLLRPYPWMSNLYEYTNKGASRFHSLNFQYNHRLSKGIQTTVNYQRTWQYDKDFQANAFDADPTWRLSDNSRPSRLTLTGRLELPFGKGQRWLQSGILSKIFGGQTFDFSYEAQQGELVDFGNIIYTGDPKNMGSLKLDHPVYVMNPATGDNYVQWLNPAVVDHSSKQVSSTHNVRIFSSRVDGIRQQGINNFNVNYQRSISISERVKFVGRFEAIDVFNHRIVGGPNTDPTSASYGRITSNNGDYGRWIQIQGKITF